jgi:hypothetical protein
LVEVPIGGGSERPIGSDRWSSTVGLACTSDGKGLLVLAQENPGGPQEIVYVSRQTGMARKTTTGVNDYYSGLSITADSRSLATVPWVSSTDLWVGQWAAPDSFHPITTNGYSIWGTWTPDGKVVYANYGGGASAWIMEADGSGARQLAPTTPFNIGRFRVSPNGKYIVFNSWKTGSPHVWRMNLDGSNPRQLTNSPDDANYGAALSPDSKWVFSRVGRTITQSGKPGSTAMVAIVLVPSCRSTSLPSVAAVHCLVARWPCKRPSSTLPESLFRNRQPSRAWPI